jgi:transcriptional regulator with XRE-family HTH domain
MNLVELAQRLKTLRLDKRLTLEEVAEQTGLTRSWLSKVENFRVTPSLPALGQIARALNVPVAELVRGLDERPEIVVIRRDERQTVERDRGESQTVYQSLAFKRKGRRMDPFMLTVPAGDVKREPLPHEGEEFLIVVSGKIDFEYNGELYCLEAGDSLYFDGNVKHRLLNNYKKPAEVLCVFLETGDSSYERGDDTAKKTRKRTALPNSASKH